MSANDMKTVNDWQRTSWLEHTKLMDEHLEKMLTECPPLDFPPVCSYLERTAIHNNRRHFTLAIEGCSKDVASLFELYQKIKSPFAKDVIYGKLFVNRFIIPSVPCPGCKAHDAVIEKLQRSNQKLKAHVAALLEASTLPD